MKSLSRRKKMVTVAADLKSKHSKQTVDLKKASRVLIEMAKAPEAGRNVEVQVYKNDVVLRFENENTLKRVAKSLAGGRKPAMEKWTKAYASAVGQLYSADAIDTEKAVTTARKNISEKEKDFYSRFSPVTNK